MTIGEKLVALRKNSKLSQEKMAEKLGTWSGLQPARGSRR